MFAFCYRFIVMTPDKLKTIIAQKEGTEIEFKESKDKLRSDEYDDGRPHIQHRNHGAGGALR